MKALVTLIRISLELLGIAFVVSAAIALCLLGFGAIWRDLPDCPCSPAPLPQAASHAGSILKK
jgi:hypothetical protein